MSTDRKFRPGTVPAALVTTLMLIGLLLLAGVLVPALMRGCSPEPVQMIPVPMPAATSTAIASSSAAVTASQSVRVTVRRAAIPMSPNRAKIDGFGAESKQPPGKSHELKTDDQGEEIVIEVSQGITTAATSSAQASASVEPLSNPYKFSCTNPAYNSHGRLGIIAATMPGVLAADLQLVRLDASPVTRWLVGVPMEAGMDVALNLEAGALGVSAGGKAFVLAGWWSRWDMGAQGVAIGAGMRF